MIKFSKIKFGLRTLQMKIFQFFFQKVITKILIFYDCEYHNTTTIFKFFQKNSEITHFVRNFQKLTIVYLNVFLSTALKIFLKLNFPIILMTNRYLSLFCYFLCFYSFLFPIYFFTFFLCIFFFLFFFSR